MTFERAYLPYIYLKVHIYPDVLSISKPQYIQAYITHAGVLVNFYNRFRLYILHKPENIQTSKRKMKKRTNERMKELMNLQRNK